MKLLIERQTRTLAAIATLLLMAPEALLATVPSVMNFQAVLLDDQGQVVTDSTYEIEFGIYPASAGVPAIWQEVQTVTTSGGLFNTMLGNTTPLTSDIFMAEAWLQMRLTASPEPFLPRTRIGSTPYAYTVQSIDQSKGGQVSGKLVVDTAEVGRAGIPGRLSVIQSNATEGAIIKPYGSLGTSLSINDEAGNACIQLRPDNSGEGGWMYVHRNASGGVGFTVEGNTGATSEPSVRISGSTQLAEFDLSHTGSAAVSLPPDAIEASEVLDEPGLASNVSTSYLDIGTSRTNLLNRTIDAPADGFVFVIGTVEIDGYGDSCEVGVGVTNSPVDWPASQHFREWLKKASGDSRVVTVNAVFPVSAGADVIYLVAEHQYGPPSAGARAIRRNLSVLFFPTSYGSVTPPTASNESDITAQEATSSESIESLRANAERANRELDQMKARLLELEEKMSEQENQQLSPRQ